jgi:hypothetical protein
MPFILQPFEQLEREEADGAIRPTVHFMIPLSIAFQALRAHSGLEHRTLRHPSVGHVDLMHMRIRRPSTTHRLPEPFA